MSATDLAETIRLPDIWLLLGDKLGDNAQVEQVVAALGLPMRRKNLVFLEQYRLGKPTSEASLYHVDLKKSDPLEGPWPELIITTGRRPDMVARWIREQSGGHTRIILFGRPKKDLDDYALIVAPGQYLMPDRPNVLSIGLPLMRVNQEKLEQGRAEWQGHFEQLDAPITGILVGGPTKPYAMPASVAQKIAQEALRGVSESGGSIFLTTSRRTPPEVSEFLKKELEGKAELHFFGEGTQPNPYFGLLACADRFIVTGDSVSMMVEVARLGKPLAICELPLRSGLAARAHKHALCLFHRNGAPLRFVAGRLQDLGMMGYPRDLTAIHRHLYECGAALPLGRGFPESSAMITDEVDRVSQKIRDLVRTNTGADPEERSSEISD